MKKHRIEIKRYKTINECLCAFFKVSNKSEIPQNGNWVWQDANGCLHEMSQEDALKKIRNRNVWGWLEGKSKIHYFARKKATLKQLIGLFAHELGHHERPYYNTPREEQKANKYSEVAKFAYELAMKHVLGQ